MLMKKPRKMDYFKEREPIQDWEKNYIKEQNRFRKMLRKNREKGDGQTTFDFTDAMSKRRNRAALALLLAVLDRYKSVVGDDEIAVGEEWRDLNMPFQTYSHIDAQSHILFAAAIWILDQIVDKFEDNEGVEGYPEFWTGWRKIFCYLPTDEDLLDDVISCDVWDPQYDYDFILSVEYVLHNRDEVEKDGGGYPRVLTSERLAANKNKQGNRIKKKLPGDH